MALSQDEQRMLAEIERRLASDDPSLASCLTTFRRPGPATVLRSPRARIIGSLFTVLLVAMVSMMVYAMVPFRHASRHSPPTDSAPGSTSISAVANDRPNRAEPSKSTTTSASTSARSTATGNAQQAKTKPTELLPETSP